MTGVGRAVGTTHFCIWLANYEDSVKRKKTALIEWNTHDDFSKIQKLCIATPTPSTSYRIFNVDYFKNAGPSDLLLCLKMGYEKIIIDFALIEESKTDFLRCDVKIVIGSLSEWKFDMFREYLRGESNIDQSWKYLVAFGDETTRKQLQKAMKISLLRIPFSVDAFSIDAKSILWFEQLTSDNI